MSGPIMDFPAAWEFVRGTEPEQHAERCSWRTEAGALLCDCSVLWIEYGRRQALADHGPCIPADREALTREVAEALHAEFCDFGFDTCSQDSAGLVARLLGDAS